MHPAVLYITAASQEEAISITHALLGERLIACANILPGATSIYRWQGQIEQAHEVVIIAKTADTLIEKITGRVKSLHSYSCPCIISLPIQDGNPEYLQWLKEQLGEF